MAKFLASPIHLYVFVTLILVACTDNGKFSAQYDVSNSRAEFSSDIARTFDQALVIVPSQEGKNPQLGLMSERNIKSALEGRLWPVVIYLHGCTGLNNDEVMFNLAAAGFLVIGLDSFARKFRPLQCEPANRSGGDNIFVYDFRLTEISYAIHRLKQVSWVDWRNIFLLGVSEGGVAAALYRGNEFKGRVIGQWTCHGHPFVRGMAKGGGEPVFAIVQKDDPWYASSGQYEQAGHCGEFFEDRQNSVSFLHRGDSHRVMGDWVVSDEIISFLRGLAHLKP